MYPDLKLIIVDFITLMQSSKKYENRNLEVGALSRELKNLASELNIPVVALAQLKRGKTADQQPSLEDLRDSGELEQNANKVIFLWEIDKANGKIGVSVAKNRRGKTGSVVMRFIGEHMRYIETQESAPKKRYNNSAKEVFGEDLMDG
jgi:replicative DNA helicase